MIKEHVIKNTVHSEWTLYGDIDGFNTYEALFTALKEAQDGDAIELRINCTGGDASVGFMIVQAMAETKATIVCNVVYPSYSMGAIIAVAGDYLIMQPHTFLMFHTYSTGMGGKSGDLIQMLKHDDAALKGMMAEVCVPFLSKKELAKMHTGDDIYITADDQTLEDRLKRHYPTINIHKKK